MGMAAEDKKSLEEIHNARLHRLRLLEHRQAIEGFRTPPEVVAEIAQTRVEIAQTKAEIAVVESAMSHPVDVQMAEDMGPGARFLATDKKLDLVIKMFTERMDRMEEHADARYQSQEAKHEAGARLYQFLFVLLSIGVILSLVIGAFLIGGAFK